MADILNKYSNLIKLILLVIALATSIYAGFSWIIDLRIEKKTSPMVEAIEFQTLIIMQTVPDSTYNHAVRMWKSSKNIIPERK